MNALRNSIERLRSLVGMQGWDYCVIWKLGDEQRCIEWMSCCCGGIEIAQKGEENLFPVSTIVPCRDLMYQHSRTKACDLLAELPFSMPSDYGIHAQVLILSQPKWLNLSNISDSNISNERIGTRVLIPVTGGLVELFVEKCVPEDQQIIDFVMAQCNSSWEEEAMNVRNNKIMSFCDQPASPEIDGQPLSDGFAAGVHPPKPLSADGYKSKRDENNFHQWIPPTTDNLNMGWDLSGDQTRICNSPLNFFGGAPFPPLDNRPKSNIFFEGSSSDKPLSINSAIDHVFPEISALQHSLLTNSSNLHPSITESLASKEHHDKDSVKTEMGRGDSISDCSDQIEDGDDQKAVGRPGRRHQSKNLKAERKRRKKLNDRLYSLRSLVPNISKMDKASILGDAIGFVKELQKQVKDLQDELEEMPEEEEAKQNDNNKDNVHLEIPDQNAVVDGDGELPNVLRNAIADHGRKCSSSTKSGDLTKQSQDLLSTDDKAQQMEVQVEVSQAEGNEFFVKIFCEDKPGGFLKLMEAMNSLGLEVTNANVTTYRGLVLNVFRVERRNSEIIKADQVRDSLLALTRNTNGGWPESKCIVENGGSDYLYCHHHQQQQQQNHHHHLNSHHHTHHLHHQSQNFQT